MSEGNGPEQQVTVLPPGVPEGAATVTGELPVSPNGQPLEISPKVQQEGIRPLFDPKLQGAHTTGDKVPLGELKTGTQRHTTPNTAATK